MAIALGLGSCLVMGCEAHQAAGEESSNVADDAGEAESMDPSPGHRYQVGADEPEDENGGTQIGRVMQRLHGRS